MNGMKKVPVPNTAGYPETEIGMDAVRVKGKLPPSAKKKVYSEVRGAGAATKGKRFLKT